MGYYVNRKSGGVTRVKLRPNSRRLFCRSYFSKNSEVGKSFLLSPTPKIPQNIKSFLVAGSLDNTGFFILLHHSMMLLCTIE
jgi:hypothetical protein